MEKVDYKYTKEDIKCPRCKKMYNAYHSLSRVDNKTKICPECGNDEASIEFALCYVNSFVEIQDSLNVVNSFKIEKNDLISKHMDKIRIMLEHKLEKLE